MKKYNTSVKIWIFIGLVMLIVQVVVGGITRLTGSGLSITKWEIITGTFLPGSEIAWNEAFDLYKETPQYREINEGMELGSIFESGTFKFIYFWEWVHRFWARIMGFVFLFPFIAFCLLGYFDKMLKHRMIGVFILAGLAASFGWIMVASGLVERPWVNAYKLALHLSIAFLTYAYLFWTFCRTQLPDVPYQNFGSKLRFGSLAMIFTGLLCFQIFLGGIMSGMKAGVFYPTWPDMNGEYIPQLLFNSSSWTVENVNYYERHPFMAAMIQTLHRVCAYLLFFIGLYYTTKVIKANNNRRETFGAIVLVSLLIIQVILGIVTVIACQGSIPVGLGVAHQFVALLLITAALFMNYLFAAPDPKVIRSK